MFQSSRGDGVAVSDVYEVGHRVANDACGREGDVLRATRRSDGAQLAVKRIIKTWSYEGRDQLSVWELVGHESIVGVVEWFEDDDQLWIVMELARGDLFERIVSGGVLEESEAARVILQMLQAVSHMHTRRVVHCDIKPENILVVVPDKMAVKLADFGFAQVLDSCAPLRHRGSPGYRAPEVLDHRPFGAPADMWSLGVVLYVMLTGCLPFGDCERAGKIAAIVAQGDVFAQAALGRVSADAVDLLRRLLAVAPEQRLTADQALGHAWVVNHANEAALAD